MDPFGAPRGVAGKLPPWSHGGKLGGMWSSNGFKFRKKMQRNDTPFMDVPFFTKHENPQDTKANMDFIAGRSRWRPTPVNSPYPYFSTGSQVFNQNAFRKYLFQNAGLIGNENPLQLRGRNDPRGTKGRYTFSGRNRPDRAGPFALPRERRSR